MPLDTAHQPTIGRPQALVQVVAFLEPKCPDSKRYNLDSFPRLHADYIKSGLISYSVITTSFLPQSMPAAIALLCVYEPEARQPRTDQFFRFLDYLYMNQPPEKNNWATAPTLQKFATAAGLDTETAELKSCLETGRYKDQIEKNTAYGNLLMGHLSTPTIYVDGVKVANKNDTIDYDSLKEAIENALKEKNAQSNHPLPGAKPDER